ncbi:hypothetical protein FocnCong_v006354 [Fusarium oxysporum f. sp. conglutinans]|nr:hypothetical protein FocnCong_v006354 [Fusarium oxysporum f. sp. conglutinans]
MFRTFRQFGFIFAISIVSSLTVISLVSYVRDQRSCDDFDAPGVAFALTPDYGTAAIFFEYGPSTAVATVEGTPAYKDFILRQNAT